jgi:hypothetical protein
MNLLPLETACATNTRKSASTGSSDTMGEAAKKVMGAKGVFTTAEGRG